MGSTFRGTLLKRRRVISFYMNDCFVMGNTALSLNFKSCLRSCQCFRFLPLISFVFLLGMRAWGNVVVKALRY